MARKQVEELLSKQGVDIDFRESVLNLLKGGCTYEDLADYLAKRGFAAEFIDRIWSTFWTT